MKFWKWEMNIKTKRLNADERIGFLANALIKELKASGRSIEDSHISEGFGSLDIYVHRLNTEDASMNIENTGKWRVEVKPTFTEF
jgi:hypothetical protein